ncbi:Ohr family peroxiredoxin [Nocardioides sp. CFH 31398]|uniref:Ohr family peroxiredoxin n=1 Tax=Nocardioides sp. CFH 31398 TaxID=2919579 RepID=UPI001F061465|nr:Ohr family peroxiredoxin [Nocardioides sp. CFH 31398]MCH1866243.1 Ohr family peroxiredoxin [Nocardioides sp. CFH 31398]
MTNTPEKIVYTAHASVTGGRRGGTARTDDGNVQVTLNAPKEMGGSGDGTNPEQLFALGYGACFNGALAAVAKKKDVDASGAELEIAIGFGPDDVSYALTADITVRIPGVDDETAQGLANDAHAFCPYSRAIDGNVPVTVTGVGA